MSVQIFPVLDDATEAALRASIERFGVLVPVVKDQNGRTLDGHHRSRIADELGVEYRVDVRGVADDGEAREIARTLNADRRHLTTKQRREVVVALREGGHSYRAIGGALGVDEKTAWNDVNKSTVEHSTVDEPERIVGLDGKSRPARQPQPEPQPEKRRGSRLYTDQPFVAKKPGQVNLANGQRRRLEEGLSEARGLTRGLTELDLRMAAAVMTAKELDQWARVANEIANAMRALRTQLLEVRHDAQAA